jgi:preprotein translocase subunit YajC
MMLANFASLMAQQQGQPAPGGSMLTALLPFALVFVIFYFLLIRPQRTKQKKHQGMVEQLKAGDKIVTSGGIHGTIMGVQEDKIELRIASNTKVDISKNAIAVILGKKTETK